MKTHSIIYILLACALIVGGILAFGPHNKPETKFIGDNSTNIMMDDDLRITYTVYEEDEQVYSIVTSNILRATGAEYDGLQISGKACNGMSGTYPIVTKDERVDGDVLVTLDDGRMVLDAPIVSTLMACDSTDPEFDDGKLSSIIIEIAKSIESY